MISAFARLSVVSFAVLAIAGCSMGGGGQLSAGLSQRMDMPGVQLNRSEAIGIINNYRSSTGAGQLAEDPTLDANAQALAAQYAKTGKQAAKPPNAVLIRYSAGYFSFGETFSGWRNSPTDAAALTDRTATKAGVAAVYDSASPYGVYWVLILG
jgi:uncharacterized protein YkwD